MNTKKTHKIAFMYCWTKTVHNFSQTNYFLFFIIVKYSVISKEIQSYKRYCNQILKYLYNSILLISGPKIGINRIEEMRLFCLRLQSYLSNLEMHKSWCNTFLQNTFVPFSISFSLPRNWNYWIFFYLVMVVFLSN